ncbi:hypothetical protein, partial [Streptomyces deserti]
YVPTTATWIRPGRPGLTDLRATAESAGSESAGVESAGRPERVGGHGSARRRPTFGVQGRTPMRWSNSGR